MTPREILVALEHCQTQIHLAASRLPIDPGFVSGYQRAVTDLRVIVQADDAPRETEAAS